MSIALLDIHDCNLQLWHGQTRTQSPGYALLDGNSYVFGEQARAAARLRPRGINTRFWWQLGTDPLQPALGPARHTADLAHAHLQELHRAANRPDEVIFTTSSSMQREQLALLLGIANECDFAAVGLVNRSVALGGLYAATARTWHLELQLHQACLSELVRSADQLELGRVIPLPGSGLLQLQESIVKLCSRAFIEQTRFDPLRKAASEQQLYDALPAALRRLKDLQETNIEIDGYQARLQSSDLSTVGERLTASVERAIGGAAGMLILDPVLTLLPGFTQGESLYATSTDVHIALDRHGDAVVQRDDHLHHVTALPCLLPAHSSNSAADANADGNVARPPASEATSPATKTTAPTHLLRGFRATPLPADAQPLHAGWHLNSESGAWQLIPGSCGAKINTAPCERVTRVFAGDTISIDDQPAITLIRVEP